MSEPLVLPHKVHVLREHIDSGPQRSCLNCVVAQAIRATLPEELQEYNAVVVRQGMTHILGYAYLLPRAATVFIDLFDSNLEIEEWYEDYDQCWDSVNQRIIPAPARADFQPFEFKITTRSPRQDRLMRKGEF